MSEIDLYLDELPTKILELQDVSLCRALFSQHEYFTRAANRSHPVVRTCLKSIYEGEVKTYQYLYSPRAIIRERLAIQGYSSNRIEEMWHHARSECVELEKPYLEPAELRLLQQITFQEWKVVTEQRALAKFDGRPDPHPGFRIERISESGPLWDPFAQLALQLDSLRPTAVWVDLTNAFDQHGFDPSLSLIANLKAEEQPYDPILDDLSPILILTEGKTDQRVISAAMEALYPEFSEAYQFMEFEEFRVEGGASPLARMVKAFAGIRVRSRILAIFDNDAAGLEALKGLGTIKLPPNLRTMCLPNLRLAEGYPTQGPEGLRRMDVNGRACAIELFLGRECLTDDGGVLRPVRWTQFVERVQRYQGEVTGKAAVTEQFLRSLDGSPKALRRRFPEMVVLLQAIFGAFKG